MRGEYSEKRREICEGRLTELQSYSPRPKFEFGEPLVDAGWSTGGEDTDGGGVPNLVDPNAHMKVQGRSYLRQR